MSIKNLTTDSYTSLRRWGYVNYKENRNLEQSKQIILFRKFIAEQKKEMYMHGYNSASFTRFVHCNSEQFRRKILNAYFSEMIGVRTSDALSFIKENNRQLHYTELRILARLRNKCFRCEDFVTFVNMIDPHDLSNRMGIDMGLLEVLNHFIVKAREPKWVDSLILTHRVVKGLWYNGSKFLNSYTLHNEEHAVTLINKVVRIVKTIDYLSIKNVDYFILFLACYLHDISMVLHPDLYGFSSNDEKSVDRITEFLTQINKYIDEFNTIDSNDSKNIRLKKTGNFMVEVFRKIFEFFESEVRNNHPKESASYIRNSANKFFDFLSPVVLSYVAKVSESHGYDSADVYGIKSTAKNDLVSLKYMMILIRLADLLDVANDRVNYHLLRENIRHMSPTSRFHWISHLVTDEIQLTAKYPSVEKPLDQKPITEILNFDLYLNVKFMSALQSKDRCHKCEMEYPSLSANPSEEYKKSDCITLHIRNSDKCQNNTLRCPFMCRWVMAKHGWLINELYELKNYLYSVNTSMIHTEINLNIFFRDEYNLDADLIDYVKEYLES